MFLSGAGIQCLSFSLATRPWPHPHAGKLMKQQNRPTEVLIVAVEQTAGSALYGMLDVLLAAGNIWQTLVRSNTEHKLFNVRIVSPNKKPFTCGNNIPVKPDCTIKDNPKASIIILPELDAVIVFTGGNYQSPEPVDTIMEQHILPAITR